MNRLNELVETLITIDTTRECPFCEKEGWNDDEMELHDVGCPFEIALQYQNQGGHAIVQPHDINKVEKKIRAMGDEANELIFIVQKEQPYLFDWIVAKFDTMQSTTALLGVALCALALTMNAGLNKGGDKDE